MTVRARPRFQTDCEATSAQQYKSLLRCSHKFSRSLDTLRSFDSQKN